MHIPVTEAQFLSAKKEPAVRELVTRNMLELKLADGGALRGVRLSRPAPKATLIYFYGNGGSLARSERRLWELSDTYGVDVVSVDYRGNGMSDGEMSLKNMGEDSLRVFDAVQRPGVPTLVMGYSLGSAMAIHTAANRNVDGLAILAGLSGIDDVIPSIKRLAPWYARPFVALDIDPVFMAKPQPGDLISVVKAPTLIVHGEADETVPISSGENLNQRSAARWKRFTRLPNIGHDNLSVTGADTSPAIREWIDASIKPSNQP